MLGYLLSASKSSSLGTAAKATIFKTIDDLKKTAERRLATAQPAEKGYLLLTLDRIKDPSKEKASTALPIPPGSPIGCDWE